MKSERRGITIGAAVLAVALSFLAGAYFIVGVGRPPKVGWGLVAPRRVRAGRPTAPADSVELSETQLKSVRVETVGERDFRSRNFPWAASTSMRTPDPGVHALSGQDRRHLRQDRG